MAGVNINKTLATLVILIFISCNNNFQDINIEYPKKLKFDKNIENYFYLVIKNNSLDNLIVEKVNTSCNCINSSESLPLLIKANNRDSVKIKIMANKPGKHTENIVLVHNFEGRFISLNVNYEVY